jgi:hypothetical protein
MAMPYLFLWKCCQSLKKRQRVKHHPYLRIISGSLLLLSIGVAEAITITIEPDDFALGTDLSNISPFVSLSSSAGDPVFSSSIHRENTLAAAGNDTGPLGQRVFSTDPNYNLEWFYSPGLGVESGLVIDFHRPVSSFSITIAELFPDAGGYFADPVLVDVFAPDGGLVERIRTDVATFGTDYLGEIDLGEGPIPAWPYGTFEYGNSLIGKVVIGGDSEPTTLDRLSFTVVPEPQGLALMCLGLIVIVLVQTKKRV